MRRLIKLFVVFTLIASVLAAHPAEQALVLLLPTELYTMGGTLAVAASIVLISVLPGDALHRWFGGWTLARGAAPLGMQSIASLLASAAFFALIFVGITGPDDPQANLLPLMLWTGWWIGVFTIQGLAFDIWRWINPWTGLYDVLIGTSAPMLKMPKSLAAWPAVIIFLAFQIFLLADIAPSDPDRLASFALGYWVASFIGMALFGKEIWLSRAECFTVLFRLIGSLRIVHRTGGLRIGLPGWRSVQQRLDPSLATFCLMILISGSFDGLKETFFWLGLIGVNPLEFPGRSAVVAPSVIGLIGANAGVIVIYCASLLLGIAMVKALGTGRKIALKDAYCRFAIAILPIALGYHVAHYFVTFLVQSQYLAATLGDPMAKGWNLFGLGQIRVTTGFLNTTDTVRSILLTKVAAVVISHIVSVIMAHRLAGDFAATRRDLILLQIGLSALMIAYTLFGLWLLSTPRGA